jgi:hypothetical protein
MSNGRAFPVEDFVQAFTGQLDRAQDMLALKARTGRPITFALKDLSIDLHVFWEVEPNTGRMLMRHAGPNEEGSSVLHFTFTTITKSMAEENSLSVAQDEDSRPLDELQGGAHIDEATRKKLEWAGVRTVGQLRRISKDPAPIQQFFGASPVEQLQQFLAQASRPTVSGHDVVRRPGGDPLLRIRGANLTDGVTPEVRLSGEPVEVVQATPSALLVRPMSHHREGQVEVFVNEQRVTGFYRMPAPPQPPSGANGANGGPL